MTLSVNATDPDGTISQVQFDDCSGNTITTITAPPYSFAWTVPQPYYDQLGFYDTFVCARATDNFGATAFAGSVYVDYQPTVTLTSPANGASFTAPATIQLTATHSTPGGPIQKMQFFNGTTLLGEDLTNPYTFDWQTPPSGTHTLTAKAIANDAREYPSPVATITVSAEAKLHFIEVDHLNTPRRIENQTQQPVWTWDQQEPFGVNVPNENPEGLGSFEFPLRFPGQYFDKETGDFYNWMRSYSAALGRYHQSDPVGLFAGINTFAYANSDPLRQSDSVGLTATCAACPPRTGPWVANSGIPRGKPWNAWECEYSCLLLVTCAGCPDEIGGVGYGDTPAEARRNARTSTMSVLDASCRGLSRSCGVEECRPRSIWQRIPPYPLYIP
jgi:RHS repeat-associated protein